MARRESPALLHVENAMAYASEIPEAIRVIAARQRESLTEYDVRELQRIINSARSAQEELRALRQIVRAL